MQKTWKPSSNIRFHLHEVFNSEGSRGFPYNRFMTFLIVTSLIPLCFKGAHPFLTLLSFTCTVVFIVDYLLRWSVADLQLKRGRLSFLLYPFTPMAIVDILSILPVFLLLNPSWTALRVFRLARAIRALKLIRYSRAVATIHTVFTKQKESLLTVIGLSGAYIFISALIIFNVEPETFNSFFDALYWAVVSLTTVGYGDLYPTSDVGRTIAMFSSLMGVAIVALPSGIITAGLMDELQKKTETHTPGIDTNAHSDSNE